MVAVSELEPVVPVMVTFVEQASHGQLGESNGSGPTTVKFRATTPGFEGLIVTLLVLRVAVIQGCVTGWENLTVPENPFVLETVILEIPEAPDKPCVSPKLAGFGVSVKLDCGGCCVV